MSKENKIHYAESPKSLTLCDLPLKKLPRERITSIPRVVTCMECQTILDHPGIYESELP